MIGKFFKPTWPQAPRLDMSEDYNKRWQEQQEREEREKKARIRRGNIAFMFIFLSLAAIVGPSIYLWAVSAYSVDPQYRRVIGDYVSNAKDAPTLKLFKDYLNRSKQAMIQQGLTPDLYNSAWTWDQTPSNRMDFQYLYMNQLSDRVDFLINQTKTNNISQFSDVYNTMMANLRAEADRNGPLDWVAHGAWELKYYPLYWWFPTIATTAIGVWVLVAIVLVVVAWRKDWLED